MSGKHNKGDIEYHTSVLHEEINFDWTRIEFKYQDGSIFCICNTGPFAWRI